MSADNWAICPRCLARKEAEAKRAMDDAYAQYGRVPVQEFEKLRDAAFDLSQFDRERLRTFREDYEVYGAEEGEVHVDYSGACSTCSLEFHFNDRRPIKGTNDA